MFAAFVRQFRRWMGEANMVLHWGVPAIVGGLALAGSPVRAADYQPVACTAAKPYVGPSIHAPIVAARPPVAPEAAFDARTTAALDAAFAKAKTATAAPAMTAAVFAPGRGFWSRDEAGDGRPLLFWASAGKTFTATVILQLADEGRLSLSDPVAKWAPGVPNGDVITVRDLLAHTSGLFSANEDLKARAAHRAFSLEEDLAIVRRHRAMFCPGERWRYSNTGYALLGAIIEKVDGRAYGDAITARIIAPLALKRMRVVRPSEAGDDISALTSAKEAPIEPSWAGAAGPIAASADDMVRFWTALLDGRLLKPETVQAMLSAPYPMFDAGTFYGLGVMAFEVPQPDGAKALWLGHAGGTPGAGAVVFYAPADRTFVAVALTGDGSATATANLLLTQSRDASIKP
jgi:D-alanyl-D-alanine carboxypeptidase